MKITEKSINTENTENHRAHGDDCVCLCADMNEAGSPAYGRQAEPIEGAVAFVLASPSGRARSFWTLAPWREVAAFVMERRLMRERAA